MDIDIRELTRDDWRIKRSLRLAALKDSPASFMGDYATAAERDESAWREWMGAGVAFAAFDGDEPVALVGGHRPDHLDGHAEVVAMWVSPRARGRRLAAALLDRVVAWARNGGADGVYLEFVDGNEAARTAYLRHGFVPTDEEAGMPGAVVMRLEVVSLSQVVRGEVEGVTRQDGGSAGYRCRIRAIPRRRR